MPHLSRHAGVDRRSARLLLSAMLVALLAFAGTTARAEFKLSVDLKDGAKIHDIAKIVAHADSSDGIDKVEFYVDDQLKATAQGVPYSLTWDTIADKEGKHTLSVTAYDSNGNTKKISVDVDIDNDLGLGAEALATKAHEALEAGDIGTASAYSRRSLKAESGNILASRVTAMLAARDSDWDKAARVLEAANGYDSDPVALKELATYRLRKAMLPENQPSFSSSIQSYIDLNAKADDMLVAALKSKEPSNHEAIGDALLKAGRYKDAQLEYQKAGDTLPVSTTNRLALAYTLQDNNQLALSFLHTLIESKRADNVTRAVLGLTLLRSQKFVDARAAVAEDLAAGYPAAQIIAAYSDVVMGKARNALEEADAAVKAAPEAGDAHFADSMVIRNLADSEGQLVRAITLSPLASGPYIDYAARIALQKDSDRMEDAQKLLGDVVARDPDCVAAKLVQVLLLLSKNRIVDAEPILDFQMRHTRSADVQMIAAIYLTQTDKVGQAQQAWDRARMMDPDHFDFIVVPKAAQFLETYDRKLHYRADFYLTFDSLFPAKRAPKPAAPVEAPAL